MLKTIIEKIWRDDLHVLNVKPFKYKTEMNVEGKAIS